MLTCGYIICFLILLIYISRDYINTSFANFMEQKFEDNEEKELKNSIDKLLKDNKIIQQIDSIVKKRVENDSQYKELCTFNFKLKCEDDNCKLIQSSADENFAKLYNSSGISYPKTDGEIQDYIDLDILENDKSYNTEVKDNSEDFTAEEYIKVGYKKNK